MSTSEGKERTFHGETKRLTNSLIPRCVDETEHEKLFLRNCPPEDGSDFSLLFSKYTACPE